MNNITNFNEQEITLEDSTKLFYVNKSKFLYKKAKRELGINNDEEIDERQLVMWLIDNMDKVNKKNGFWWNNQNPFLSNSCVV